MTAGRRASRKLTKSFERATQREAAPVSEFYVMQLYVAGGSRNSLHAISNLKRICDRYLAGRYQIRIIDIQQHWTVVKARQILAVPTLEKLYPRPAARLIGDLSNIHLVLKGLGIKAVAGEERRK